MTFKDTVEQVVQQMLVDYTAWTKGESVAWNVKKQEALTAIVEAHEADVEREIVMARLDELRNVCDEVGLFTKYRHPAVYNVQLPIQYLYNRLTDIKAMRIQLSARLKPKEKGTK